MSFSRTIGAILILLGASQALFASAAQAAPMVTYSWTTTNEGYGQNVSAPSSATFEVPLSDVLNGVIPQSDITDIQLFYPGLTFDTAAASSIGFDFSAFVDPATGAFVFHDIGQGLAVIAFAGTDINDAITFLSITVDNPNLTLNGVADEFNALDNGIADAGYPTAGYWTASFPPAVPEPTTWAMTLLGFVGLGYVGSRRREALSLLSLREPSSA
jgi:hypothetical protein